MIDLSRRRFLSFAPLIVAAPAIVRASSLMPIKVLPGYDEIRVVQGATYTSFRADVVDLLMPGLREIIQKYDTIPSHWNDLLLEGNAA